MRRLIAITLLMVLALTPVLYPGVSVCKEGKLQKFEKAVEKKPEKKSRTDYDYDDDDSYTDSVSGTDIATSAAMNIFYSFFLMGLTSGATESSGDFYSDLKATGSPALPTIKFEPSYQFLVDNIHGVIGKAEVGYLTFGVDAEYIRYFESNAPDLTFISGHLLLRTLFARVIGINLALGVKSIWGSNKHTGFDFGFPFYLYLRKYLIFDIQPYIGFINNNRVYDMSAGISLKYNVVGARVAYRGIYAGGQTLHGPQVGVFIQW